MPLQNLPNEITADIAKYLDVNDLLRLARTCRHYHHLIYDENICRYIAEVCTYIYRVPGGGGVYPAALPSRTPTPSSRTPLLTW